MQATISYCHRHWKQIAAVATVIYIACMVGIPAYQHEGSWGEIQAVWDRWQTLNSAMIALAASLIALFATQYSERKGMERKFLAATVLLPHALSELSEYLSKSAELYTEAMSCVKTRGSDEPKLLTAELPIISDNYKVTFSQCIEHGDVHIAQFLGDVLKDLQVHQARMKNLKGVLGVPQNSMHISQKNIVADAYLIGHIKVLVDRLFPLARRSGALDYSSFRLDEYSAAYSLLSLDLYLGMVDELIALTKRNLEARSGRIATFSAHLPPASSAVTPKLD
jgi:hypothetical protein